VIFVERSAVRNPFEDSALAPQAAKELDRARAEIAYTGSQRRFVFTVYKAPAVKLALNGLFQGKCAYCESPLVSAAGDIEQFRPKSGVTEAPQHPGYWWLLNSWENLLIACQYCNRMQKVEVGERGRSESIGKHNRFPLIDESKRAYTPEADLSLEQPMLLDPTVDDPAPHLTFSDDGQVFSETARGNVTISTLGLNRVNLIQQRLSTALQYRAALTATIAAFKAGDGRAPDLLRDLTRMGDSNAAYAGMIRQFLQRDRRRLEQAAQGFPPTEGQADAIVPIATLGADTSLPATPVRVKRAARSSKVYRDEMASYSLADREGIARYKAVHRAIESVSIRNIRAIQAFDVNLATLGVGSGNWLMLLGENGTGKSTVLQAIALVLGGSAYVSKLIKEERISLHDLVRFKCRSGEISVKISGFDAPHRLKVYRDRLEFISPAKATAKITMKGEVHGAAWEPQTVLAGYGATRLSPRRAADVGEGGAFARVENLFDPSAPLIDAQDWLTRLPQIEFDRTAIVLKDLLAIDPDAFLTRRKGRVLVHAAGTTVSLAGLSVGYQTVVAAATDMLEILSRVWKNPLDAEGIVLIDELDAHLHPTWQMQIVSSLRRALPAVQFITTTHQPLCLRGLTEGEVVVMRRDVNHAIEVITELPSPADFRVDQLLTSPFFGLSSTTDPETERLFDRYYALLALETRTDADDAELMTLTSELERRKQFGETQREGLYLEAIDRVLARHKALPPVPQEALRQEAVSAISAIWDRLTADLVASDGDAA